MLALGVEGLEGYIRTIGLYRTKARNVLAAAAILVERYGGVVPLEREALQALPGVGRKTASVVLNQLGVEPAIAVDTHVFRGLASPRPVQVAHARRRRARPDAPDAGALPHPRAPLADPARPLCLRRAYAPVRRLPDRRSVSFPAAVRRRLGHLLSGERPAAAAVSAKAQASNASAIRWSV